MSSTHQGGRGPSRDYYETPQWCIDLLARAIRYCLPIPKWIVDLGAGDGRIGKTIREAFSTTVVVGSGAIRAAEPKLIVIETEPVSPFSTIVDGLIITPWPSSDEELEAFTDRKGPILFVSNPPYSQAQDFVQGAIEEICLHGPGSAAVFLLPLNWFGSNARVTFHRQGLPDRLSVLTPRPSFAEFIRIHPKTGKPYKVRTDSNEYAWWWYIYPLRQLNSYRGTEIEIWNREDLKEA